MRQAGDTAAPVTADDPVPQYDRDEFTRILGDRYEPRAVLGRGGMADVYRAADRLLDREVAVKVLRGNTDGEADRARFTAEARTLALLSHSGVVMVLDAGITAERPYIVMELVEGPSLAQVLEGGPLDAARVTSIGVQVAEALAYAHERGVVHRDVKPGNVLLGPGDRVKLADFGIARLLGDTARHTRTGQAIGTAAYLAPEQVTGRDVDGAADVYALGLVLLEAITGVRAFPGTPTESAVARLNRPPDVPQELSPELRHVLSAMTALDPRERPTAAQVARGLRALPAGPIPAATIRDLPSGPSSGPAHVPASTTRPITEVGTAHVSSPPAPADRPWTDRAGDAIAASARDLSARARALTPDQRALAAVLGALLLLIVIVAIVGAGSGGGGAGGERPAKDRPGLDQPHNPLRSR